MKKLISKYYSKFVKHRQAETKRIVRSELYQYNMMQSALHNNDILVNKEPRQEKIIVSLTTFGVRINSVYMAIESLAYQTLKPDKIVLWISETDFNDNNIPITLKRMEKRGLEIKYCKDIGPHTKLIYSLKEYPDDIIITIDDDIIYPVDLVENLYNLHREYPNHICCNVAEKINKRNNGEYLPYREWEIVSKEKEESELLMPLGVNGVLYPPNSLDKTVLDVELIKKLCPKADDIWFKVMALKKKSSVIVSGTYPVYQNSFIATDSSFIQALAVNNISGGQNDIQFLNCIKHFNITI